MFGTLSTKRLREFAFIGLVTKCPDHADCLESMPPKSPVAKSSYALTENPLLPNNAQIVASDMKEIRGIIHIQCWYFHPQIAPCPRSDILPLKAEGF
jgi:hypothetical protein